MAPQKRKASKGKPITSHPLFPAVVALWFGALFGLGSLAVRASLLEALVIKSRIDLIVPAAAPPLGLTARMLVALVLAACGALLGALTARRVARPKPEVRQRKREARANSEEVFSVRTLDPYACPLDPVAVSLGEGSDAAEDTVELANRRRPLAIAHDDSDFVPHETAPLPGGQPQILDIAGMNLGEPMGSTSAAFAPPAAEDAPLDLASFTEAAPQSAPAFAPPSAAPTLDWSQAKPVAAVQDGPFARPVPSMIDQQRQVFQPVEAEAPVVSEPEFDQTRQVLGQAAREQFDAHSAEAMPATELRQMFGQPTDGDQVPGECVEALGYKASVFDVEESRPLFAPRATSVQSASEQPAEQAAAPADLPASAPEPATGPAPETLPSPATLGMTELAQRLGESMRRRRAARAALAASTAGAAPVPAEPERSTGTAQESAGSTPGPVTEPEIAVPPPYVPPFAHIEPIDEPISAPFARLASTPADPAPASPFAVSVAVLETAPEAPAEVPPAPVAMPAALRPISFDDFADDGANAMLDSLLPPRSLGEMAPPVMPAPALPEAAPEPVRPEFAPVAEAKHIAEAESGIEADDGAEPADGEENYGSLLDLGVAAPRSPYVRVDEPEVGSDTIEPVVIFPGQGARPPLAAATAPFQTQPSEDDPSQFRRFDAPAQAEQGQMVAASGQGPNTDPEEAERALRAALANLQRISGAA